MSPRSCRTPNVALIALVSVIAALDLAPSALASPSVSLGTAGSFAVLAGSSVDNTGVTSLNGDMGVFPGTSITGFLAEDVTNGSIHPGDAVAQQAQTDTAAAYQQAFAMPATTTIASSDLGSQVFPPGVYASPNALSLTGSVTLDAQGNPNAVFIFQDPTTLATSSNSRVILANGAQASNVYWAVGSSAALGANSTFAGTVLAAFNITVNTNAFVQGRLLAQSSGVTLRSDTVVVPIPTATTLTSSANPSAQGDPVSYMAAVRPDSGAQAVTDGTVAFSDENGFIPGCETVAVVAASATCDPTSVPALGSHTITGTFTPGVSDFTFEESTSQPLTQTVTLTLAPPVATTPTPTPTAPVTTPPVTTTPANQAPQSPAPAKATVSKQPTWDRFGRLLVTVHCLAHRSACHGRLSVTTGSGRHRRTLATRTLSLQSGTSTTLKFELGPAAAAARRAHSVRLQVRLALLSEVTVTVTV